METITLTSVDRYTTKKDGSALVTKTGKPYTSVRIKCQEYPDRVMSGFGDQVNSAWKIADKVEVLLTQNGEYWNFSMPKKEDKVADKLEEILNKITTANLRLAQIEEHLKLREQVKKPHYPTAEEEGIDVENAGEVTPDFDVNDVPF